MSYQNSFQYNITSKLSSYQVPIPAGYIMHSKNLFTASIANHSARGLLTGTTGGTIASGLLNIPGIAGKIYTLVGMEITVKSTLTTVVPTGGLFEVFNDAIDWIPCQLLTNTSSVLGAAGGVSQTACFYTIQKPLPAGSNIYCYYTSLNAATDWVCVSFMWSTNMWQPNYYQTFVAYAYGTSRTSVATFTSDGSVAIPANKGGNLVGFMFQLQPTIVTILSTGGTVVVHNAAANMAYEPSEFSVGSLTDIASGGGELLLQKVDYAGDCPGNSTFTFDYTTISTNAQVMGYEVVWEA